MAKPLTVRYKVNLRLVFSYCLELRERRRLRPSISSLNPGAAHFDLKCYGVFFYFSTGS